MTYQECSKILFEQDPVPALIQARIKVLQQRLPYVIGMEKTTIENRIKALQAQYNQTISANMATAKAMV